MSIEKLVIYPTVTELGIRRMVRGARDVDVKEAKALGYGSLLEALTKSVETSDAMFEVWSHVHGEVIAIGGVANAEQSGVGLPWLCLSRVALTYKRQLVATTAQMLEAFRGRWVQLRNLVHVDNGPAISFLEHFDFEVLYDNPVTIGATGERFYPFVRGV